MPACRAGSVEEADESFVVGVASPLVIVSAGPSAYGAAIRYAIIHLLGGVL